MLIEFTDPNTKEYKNGQAIHYVNDGKPFEVSASVASDLLFTGHFAKAIPESKAVAEAPVEPPAEPVDDKPAKKEKK